MDQAEKLRSMVKENSEEKETSTSMARLITVTSGKGGVGKSNTSVNLAVQLRNMGYRVIIFDADFGLANVEVMFGSVPQYNLSDLIFRDKKLEEIIVEGPMGIQFISGGSGISELSNLSKENLQYLVTQLVQLETMTDIIIVDTGAGISDSVLEFVKMSEEVLIVTTPEPTSIMDSYALLKALKRSEDFRSEQVKIYVMANRVMSNDEGKVLYDKLNVVAGKFLDMKLSFIGNVPYDMGVPKAIMQQKPISMTNKMSKASLAYEEIARKLVDGRGENGKKKGIGQVFMNLFRSRTKNR